MLCAPHRVLPTAAEGILCVGIKRGNTVRGEWVRVAGTDWVKAGFYRLSSSKHEDGPRNFAAGNCVDIIEVFVCRSLLINVKPFEGVDVDAFILKL